VYHNPLFCETYDNAIRWRPNERLDHLFEERCDRLAREKGPDHPAVIGGGARLSYEGLDRRANQLARYLRELGVRADDRVGIMLRQSAETYVALLAILKANAAYVPLDPNFPPERIGFIAEDAGIDKIVTLSEYGDLLKNLPVEPVFVDKAAERIAALDDARLSPAEKGEPQEQLCYIVYTSGSTGRPKGVAIEHPSICNFVRVAAEVYGYREDDRVYQGMTIAFDFSVEEIWVPLMAGATLVPGAADATLVGKDLADFLFANEVTALCCVPTLLATIDRDLPSLRLLLVSGEACPHDLVVRWHRPGRTILNAYGPTEATVTATWTELRPDKPVTIGVPMPTYSVVILDEHENKVVPQGASGEICIAGIGLAKGYLNRADLTEKAFIPDFLGITNNPSGRIYRTGDLGRILEAGEIEYQGRIDTQVKVRGYRIELTEIESVLMEAPEIAQAVVNTWVPPEGGPKELVAYVTLKEGVTDLSRDSIAELLRRRLPGYMIPSYLERVAEIPMLPSHKADRKALPPPTGPRFTAGSVAYVAPADDLERTLAEALAEILGVERVSTADDFFADLGGHSLLMARFASVLRERVPGADISMRDIYLNPTVAKLASIVRTQEEARPKTRAVPYRIPSNLQYYGCGFLQLLTYAALVWLGLETLVLGLDWLLGASSIADIYLRIVTFNLAAFAFFSLLPIAAKWLLVGRWKQETFPIWSLKYYRFWTVRFLIQLNPILLFSGTPLYNVYLRLLGARIGRNVVIHSKSVPVCTDLISIGDNTVLRKYSLFTGHRAEAGYMKLGTVRIGRNVVVGEASVVDINTSIGDDGQLGHCSTLNEGMTIPAGMRYHGSPAQPCEADFNRVAPRTVTPLRQAVYSSVNLLMSFLLFVPILPIALYVLVPDAFGKPVQEAAAMLPDVTPAILLGVLGFSVLLYVWGFFGSLARIASLPRIYGLFLEEGRTYVLYGFHYYLYKLVAAISYSTPFNVLFGDSSYIVNYLKLVGINLPKVVQTGSNFGTEQIHDVPFFCTVGSGTMVSSRLTMLNAQFSSTSFVLRNVTIGENNFLGNVIHFHPDAKVGNNCLLATKVMVPIDGAMRENVGLLGSPAFEIPRHAGIDRGVMQILDPKTREERLRAKNRFNLQSMLTVVLSQWMLLFAGLAFAYWTIVLYGRHEMVALLGAAAVFIFLVIGYLVFLERLSLRFRKLQPDRCTILDENYWWVEHHWKFTVSPLLFLFRGTPFKNVISKLLGTTIGRKVFDDGCAATERTLTEVGSYCTLNEFAILQAHSLEEGIFKSDTVRLGKGCTIGPNAFVHYGVDLGEGTVVDTDAFLMKGEITPPGSVWRGNPARQI